MKKFHYLTVFLLLLTFMTSFNLLPENRDRGIAQQTEIDDIPVLGTVLNTGELVFNNIFKGLGGSLKVTKDIGLYTIGNMALDAYILTLPLDLDIKARMISRLVDYNYASRLTSFILAIKERYQDDNSILKFRNYIKSKYDKNDYPGMEHDLFPWDPKKKIQKDGQSFLNKEAIASLITIYDAIYSVEDNKIIKRNFLPENYVFLDKNNKEDRKLVSKVQDVVVELIEKIITSIPETRDSEMVKMILEDAKPENKDKINNKAEAITITIIDFIGLTIHKNYRSHLQSFYRVKEHKKWAKKYLKKDPKMLIGYLKYLNKRRFAFQVVVDGLQGHLMEGLTKPLNNIFLKQIAQDQQNKYRHKPLSTKVKSPEKVQSYKFLKGISSFAYRLEHDAHYLPFFKSIYKDYKNSIAQYGVSTTPTISVRNLPLAMHGPPVHGKGGTSLPNFHFIDRENDRPFYFFGNDAVLLEKIVQDNKMLSMFERLKNAKTLNCNAQYDALASTSFEALVNLGTGEAIRDFGEILCAKELSKRAETEIKLFELRKDLIEEIKKLSKTPWYAYLLKLTKKAKIKDKIATWAALEEKGLPDYVLNYNPWPDHFAHFEGPFADAIISPTGELNRLDYWLKTYSDIYKKAGVLNRTLFGMAGDHGLSPIFYYLNPEKEVLEKLSKDIGQKIKVLKISSDEGEGPKITNHFNPLSAKGYDVVIASTAGGNYMMDFFIDQEDLWNKQPHYKDLIKLNLISGGPSIDIISEIVKRLSSTLDYLVVREDNCNEDQCKIRLVGHRNGKRIDEIIERKANKIRYFNSDENSNKLKLLQIYEKNPYTKNLTEREASEKASLLARCIDEIDDYNSNTWCTDDEWRSLTRLTPKPDSVVQLSELYFSDLAGTVNLFPKYGIGYNTKVPGRHAGEHFHEKDAFVGFWGLPLKNKFEKRLPTALNGSLAPTMYEWLTTRPAREGDNHWGFNSILKEIYKK